MTDVTDLWGHTPQGRSFAFPNSKGLHVSLAKKDPSEVGPLSRQVMAPYPSRYRKALAFSDILCPLAYRPALRQAFPGEISGTQSGLPCSASTTRTGKTLSLDRKPRVPVSPIHRGITGFMPFGLGLSASLAYLKVTILATVHMRSSCPSSLAPGPPDAGSSCLSLAVWTAPKGRVHCSRRFGPGRCHPRPGR